MTQTILFGELTAEIGSCYLQAHCDIVINGFKNKTAYIHGWMEKLKNDKRSVIYASGKAQQAVDLIMNLKATDREPEHSNETEAIISNE